MQDFFIRDDRARQRATAFSMGLGIAGGVLATWSGASPQTVGTATAVVSAFVFVAAAVRYAVPRGVHIKATLHQATADMRSQPAGKSGDSPLPRRTASGGQMNDPAWAVLEGELIEAILERGDYRAYEQLVQHYQGKFYGQARIVVGASDAEDVVQESWEKIFKQLGKLRGHGAFGYWAGLTVRNTALDWLRRHKRSAVTSLDEALPDTAGDVMMAEVFPDPKTIDPSRQILLARDIDRAVDRLNERERVVLSTLLREDMPVREAAEALQISDSTVYRLQNVIRHKLSVLLQDWKVS